MQSHLWLPVLINRSNNAPLLQAEGRQEMHLSVVVVGDCASGAFTHKQGLHFARFSYKVPILATRSPTARAQLGARKNNTKQTMGSYYFTLSSTKLLAKLHGR